MRDRNVIITTDDDGQTSIEIHGYSEKAAVRIIAQIAEALRAKGVVN